MDPLSPKARALIERSRPALHAKAGDRERIEASLRNRLGPEALPLAENGVRASSLASSQLVLGATIGAVVMIGAAFWAVGVQRSAPPQPATAPQLRAAPAAPATAARAPVLAPTNTPPKAAPSAPIATNHARTRAPSEDELAREVALLARATKELRAGDARKALNTLEVHRRKFPRALLDEERRAATAQALCMLGNVREGRLEQQRLDPNSPAAARVTQACDAAAASQRAR
jgi:hypothetical protein